MLKITISLKLFHFVRLFLHKYFICWWKSRRLLQFLKATLYTYIKIWKSLWILHWPILLLFFPLISSKALFSEAGFFYNCVEILLNLSILMFLQLIANILVINIIYCDVLFIWKLFIFYNFILIFFSFYVNLFFFGLIRFLTKFLFLK